MTNIPQAYKYRYNGVIYIGGALPEGAELLETINRIDVKTAQTIETMDIVDPKADKSDLDGKADTDLSNINTSGKSFASGLAMPSGTYTDLTLGSEGSTYTAPANGWFAFSKVSSGSDQRIALLNRVNGNTIYGTTIYGSASNQYMAVYLPVMKNDTVAVYYSAGGTTQYFRFVYAKGSESEVS